jgi:hypothetical protein
MSKDGVVARIAERQHGLITREQARRAGLTDGEIAGRLRNARWVALRRGVFAIAGAPSTREQAICSACLVVDGAFASHLTAGWLWGLQLPDPADIHVTTAAGPRIRREGLVHHRRSPLPMVDLTKCRGIPVTTPARTLVDASDLVRPGRLGRVVDDALRRKLVVLADLRDCHERIATGPGRRATVAMREVLDERQRGHDPGGSDRELWVKDVLVAGGLPAPVQQHRVWVAGRRFDIDLAYPSNLVGLEFDGWDAHGAFTAFHRDRERLRLLAALGWTMLPVTARTRPADLVRDVRAALALSGHLRTG